MRNFTALLMVTAAGLVAPSAVPAWNASGHRTIASLVFRSLSEERREELAALLASHPRYQQDFLESMPEGIRGDADARTEWLLQQASVWPDIVRGGPPERTAFNRPLWHYYPSPFFLTEVDEQVRQGAVSEMNTERTPQGGTDNFELNGPQALKANYQVLNDPLASSAARAVALCWVLHLGQDLHQPCHTASLVLPRLFPQGDRGGNDVKTRPLFNLHAVWDGPLGPDDRYESCRDRAIILLADRSRPEVTVDGIDREVDQWLKEGVESLGADVYAGEVRVELLRAEASGGMLEELELSTEYLRTVRRIADARIQLAGIRLASLLAGNN